MENQPVNLIPIVGEKIKIDLLIYNDTYNVYLYIHKGIMSKIYDTEEDDIISYIIKWNYELNNDTSNMSLSPEEKFPNADISHYISKYANNNLDELHDISYFINHAPRTFIFNTELLPETFEKIVYSLNTPISNYIIDSYCFSKHLTHATLDFLLKNKENDHVYYINMILSIERNNVLTNELLNLIVDDWSNQNYENEDEYFVNIVKLKKRSFIDLRHFLDLNIGIIKIFIEKGDNCDNHISNDIMRDLLEKISLDTFKYIFENNTFQFQFDYDDELLSDTTDETVKEYLITKYKSQ